MQLDLWNGLPFVRVSIGYQGAIIEIPNVLVDTGSATSIFSADELTKINLFPAPEDILYTIRGVGGSEVVYSRTIEYLQVGEQKIASFSIEVGGMDYGFNIQGILGMDFLMAAGAILDLSKMQIEFRQA